MEFYTGLSGGISLLTGQGQVIRDANLSIPVLPANFDTRLQPPLSLKKSHPAFSIYAGTGFAWDWVYFGLEAFLKYENANIKRNGSSTFIITTPGAVPSATITDQVRVHLRKIEWGGDFRPGLAITPCTLLYAKIGAAINKLSLRNNINFLAENPGNFSSVAVSFPQTKNKKVLGLRLGGGLEQKFWENWSLRLEYTWTRYPKIRIDTQVTASIFNPVAGGLANASLRNFTQIKIRDHHINLGLSYYW